MARTQGKSGLVAVIVLLAIILVIVGTIVLAKSLNKPKVASIPTSSQNDAATTKDASTTETDTTDPSSSTTTDVPAVDPETLSSIDVEPLGISVFYTKGVPGFSFEVKKTADQTQYVEFTSPDLVGTKCTDDNGLFVSIIKNPSSNEDQSTISQTVKVGGDSYGLSLAGKGCASDIDLLMQYQTAFTNGFSSLKAL